MFINNLKGSNMRSVHELNRSKILQTLFMYAPISRIEIATIMSLTPPAITSNITSLINEGIVEEIPGGENSGGKAVIGRKPIHLNIVPDAFYAIGADWTPNGIICALTNLRGGVIGIEKAANKKWEPDSTVETTARLVASLIKSSRIPREKILGIGVAVPGFVETETGVVRYSPAHSWQNVDVRQALEAKTDFQVTVENNVRVMAVGKMLFSQAEEGRRIDGDFLYVFVGQGIACAIVNNNELLRGHVFGAGELGHTTVAPGGPLCRCGKHGCLEAIAGEYAIVQKAAAVLSPSQGKKPRSPALGDILAAYDRGDREITAILSNCVEYLSLGVANVINLINPKQVVFYGQLFDNLRLRERLLEGINGHTFQLMRTETEFIFSGYNGDLCAISGAAYAVKHFLL